MRHVIWAKEDYFPYATPLYMSAEAINIVPGKRIYFLQNFYYNSLPLGKVVDIQVADGEMTCVIDYFQSDLVEEAKVLLEAGDIRLAGGYRDMVFCGDNVVRATLHYVSWRPISDFVTTSDVLKSGKDAPNVG